MHNTISIEDMSNLPTCLGVGRVGVVFESAKQPDRAVKLCWDNIDPDNPSSEALIQQRCSLYSAHVPHVFQFSTILPDDPSLAPYESGLRQATENMKTLGVEDEDVFWVQDKGDTLLITTGRGQKVVRSGTVDLERWSKNVRFTDLVADRLTVIEMAKLNAPVSINKYLNARLGWRKQRLLFAQLLAALATLQNSISGFKHNDLHTQNVLVTLVPTSQVLHYSCCPEQAIFLKKGDPLIHIIDFGLSCSHDQPRKFIDGIYEDISGVTTIRNQCFDVQRFFQLAEMHTNVKTGPGKDFVHACAGNVDLSVRLQRLALTEPGCAGTVSVDHGSSFPCNLKDYATCGAADFLKHRCLKPAFVPILRPRVRKSSVLYQKSSEASNDCL